MAKTCDNKSVGVIVRKDGKFLLIKRRNFPVSYACVAGHLDGDTYDDAAQKEASEEIGITIKEMNGVWSGTLPNPCKRDGGHGHTWKVFEVTKWDGTPNAGSDAKEAFWASPEELAALTARTLSFEKTLGIPLHDLGNFTNRVSENADWKNNPGFEPVWTHIFREIGII